MHLGLFWARLALSATALLLLSLGALRARGRRSWALVLAGMGLGAASGLLLYGLTWLGFQLLRPLVQGSALAVYSLASDVPRPPLVPLLAFVGFCEEAFWRAFVQGALREAMGSARALALGSLLYASVHLWTLNAPLILLALFLGLVWGLLFQATRSLALVASSHAVWDELAFVFFPFVS